MYETSASWAYKPAHYNLAVMYAKGEGVPVDRPRAMAWAAHAKRSTLTHEGRVRASDRQTARSRTSSFAKAPIRMIPRFRRNFAFWGSGRVRAHTATIARIRAEVS